MIVIAEDSVRFAHSGPSQRFLRGLRPLVSVLLTAKVHWTICSLLATSRYPCPRVDTPPQSLLSSL